MRVAQTDMDTPCKNITAALERCLRPGIGFTHPTDVLKDPFLDEGEKRSVLASWASDASAVEGEPSLRWLYGTPEPVALDDVLGALARLDRIAAAHGSPPDPRPGRRRIDEAAMPWRGGWGFRRATPSPRAPGARWAGPHASGNLR
ncbi:MAG: hypothetical protein JSR86_09555 [Proteobacteria bacterium]|nr:hypothetical protein [Pseudomonadota bacterium]